ncbi:nuclear pore complex protein NUP214 isoform X1 [Cryptomeria japonica]|uniref:nuclear pore complex protein NUP214 isoform X1 n=2 Tax=Cryptomeria japonica TaxID=3369 RepID=UPI0027DA8888|nr:nuclear pore complex protein NUP214 isoform X1 [Cryptomeria japonica]XP_057823177.2 nuclear pore complex protein NUP214 isoform X1 [Cryptomeria japonica]
MEIQEGESKPTDDIIFKRIGVSIPITSTKDAFDANCAPLKALAVSNQFGLAFVAHTRGFCVTKTAELLQVAEDLKDNPHKALTVQDASIVDVALGGVSLLTLSSDGLILAACVGGTVHFFSVPDLVHKIDLKPFQSTPVYEAQYIRDFIWCMAKQNMYVALSSEGTLTCGEIGSSFEHIEEKVTAVDWSADGQDIALLTKGNKLTILSSNLRKKSHLQLPEPLQITSSNNNIKIHVDSIKWIQKDCIVIGCVGVDEEGMESKYPVYILTFKSSDLSQEPKDAEMLAFDCLFTTIDSSILPSNTGPYLLLNYVDVWDLAVAANRRNIDDHIVLLGWVLANGKKVAMSIDFTDEKLKPRIELQENADDNFVVGMAMDRTSVDFQISIPTEDGGINQLPPCPVLLCITIEGKMDLFSFARIAEVWNAPELLVTPIAVPMVHPLVATFPEDKKSEESIPSNFDSKMSVTREYVNAEDPQLNNSDNQMIQIGDFYTNDLLKDGNEIKLVPVEKTPSRTPVRNEADVNTENSHVSKHEEEITKMENMNKFQHEKAYNVMESVYNEKPTPLMVKVRETDVNVKNIQTRNEDGRKPKVEHISAFQLQDTSDMPKPMLDDKSSFVKHKSKSCNDEISQASKLEEEITKMENMNKFPLQKGDNVTEPVSNEKPTSLLVKVKEANVNVENIQTSNKDEIPKVEDTTPAQRQDTSDMPKPMLSEKSSSVKHNSKSSLDTQKLFGMPFSGPTNLFQTAPRNFLAESSSISSSSSSIPKKSVSQGESFGTVESISTRANESGSAFASMAKVNSQTVSSKADLTGFSNKEVAGKVSSETSLGNMPKSGLGTAPFGFKQSSGHLLTSSISTSNLSPVPASASASVSQLFTGVKDSYQGKTSVTGALGGFRATNAAGTISSSSIFQSGMKTSIHSTISSEGSFRMVAQSQQAAEPLVPSGTYKADLKSTQRASGMSEIEIDFSQELENVRNMGKEVDDLISNIEGKKTVSKANNISFSKRAILNIEDKIKTLSENCNEFKERLEEQLFDIQTLRDKMMQVDAWRIYMQSIIKQATDEQYQDLRNRQKLNPELDIKRQSISKSEQSLKQQILELEGHLQNLEISKFEVSDGPRRAHQRQFQNARQLQSLQSFYNTVNSQLVIAEKLASRLSQQMEALNISPDKSANSKNAKKEALFKSIGLSTDEACFQSPDLKKSSNSYSLQKFAYSPSSTASKGSSVQRESTMQEPDSLRRRRDPIDSAWANVGTAKTTVKRASLALSSRANRSRSSLELTESSISRLRTTSAMFSHEDSLSSLNSSHISELKEANISNDATASASGGPSSDLFLKRSNYQSQSLQNISNQVSNASVKSKGTDRTLEKHDSDVVATSPVISARPKTRAANRSPTAHGPTVGRQSEGMSSKPSSMQSSLEFTTKASIAFCNTKTSIGNTIEGRTSGIDDGTKVSQQHELASTQIKSVCINNREEVNELNNDASECVASAAKLCESSQPSALLQVSNLSSSLKSTKKDKKPSYAGASDYTSEHTNLSPMMQFAKPFVFSMPTGSGSVSQGANTGESKSSLNASLGPESKFIFSKGSMLFGSKPQNSDVSDAASQPKSISFGMPSLATSSGQNVTPPDHDVRTSTPQGPSLFVSKPQNTIPSVAATQSKPFSSNFSSQSTANGKSVTAQSNSSLVSSAVTDSPINESITPVSGLGGGLAASDQFQARLTKTSELDISPLSASSSSQFSSSGAAALSSMAQTSASPVSPFVLSSSQTKPSFTGFAATATGASTPAFSFSSAAASGFGQFSAPVSGSSGFGSQTNVASNVPTSFGFSNSASTHLTSQQSHSAPSLGLDVAILSPEQKTLSSLTSSSFGHTSAMISAVTNEEDMEEEAPTQTADVNIGSFSGFGLGSATSTVPKSNPFAGPLITSQPNPAFSLNNPTGELFKPASFSIPVVQSSSQSSPNLFGSNLGSGSGIYPSPASTSSFGQPAHPGPGQQALGSALGAFGQSRQIGFGSGFGASFGSPSSLSGSGFKAAGPGGGFAGAAVGGGFAAAATGSGFAGAAVGGGFSAAATGSGFAAAANTGTSGFSGGGFQSSGGNQGGGGFASFRGGSPGSTNPPQSLFTQIRK